jgi:hypothetical protein
MKNDEERILLSKLQISIHNLEIERDSDYIIILIHSKDILLSEALY